MGDIVLFSIFGFVSASCCLSVSHDARITHNVSDIPCSGLKAPLPHSNLLGTNLKIARNEFIEPTLNKFDYKRWAFTKM